ADKEVSQAIGQPAGEQGGEPADDRHDPNGDTERVEHDVVRNHQQQAEQHGDPPLPPGAGEGRQDLIARPEDWCRGRGYPCPQRYFSHFAAPFLTGTIAAVGRSVGPTVRNAGAQGQGLRAPRFSALLPPPGPPVVPRYSRPSGLRVPSG